MATTLLLVRHAQTQENGATSQRLIGWHDAGLSRAGRTQAGLLARRLRHAKLEALYSSPLRRAADTASEIAMLTALPATHSTLLKEIGCGEVEGQLLDQVRLEYRDHWQRNLRQADPDFRWPGGESYAEFRKRCLVGIGQIAARHAAQQVAVVTHAGVISQILGHIHSVNPARWEVFRTGPASITVIRWHERCATLLAFDDRTHLDEQRTPTRKEHRP